MTKRAVIQIWKRSGMIVLIVGLLCAVAAHQEAWPAYLLIFAFAWFMFPVASLMAWRVGKGIGNALVTAARPIPSPAEIELQLRLEGYEPSLQDVLAVHQLYVVQRREAETLVGIALGGLYLVNRELQK